MEDNKMNTTLLIMAAGIGSRFGTGIPVSDGRFIHRTTKAFQPSQRENRHFRFVQNREKIFFG